jgi:hypothetical protein
MAHAVFADKSSDWVARLDYWVDVRTASSDTSAEAPPTSYGRSNAKEDLAESVAIFLEDPSALWSQCPDRAAIVAGYVLEWQDQPELLELLGVSEEHGDPRPAPPDWNRG